MTPTNRAVGWCIKVTTPSGKWRYLAGAGDISRSPDRALMWLTRDAAEAAIATYRVGALGNRAFTTRRHWALPTLARWAA